ncbi:hypothetical protein ACIBCR_01855 [Micromonospora echinospora]|uniref:hypothetical protein n=1 Tax=Micromonospora echinospora TaxID=1877 RepID=UPI0037A59227
MAFLSGLVIISLMIVGVVPEAAGALVAAAVFVAVAAIALSVVPLMKISALLRKGGGMSIDGQVVFMRNLMADLRRFK